MAMHCCFLRLHHFIKRLSQRKEMEIFGKCSLIIRMELCGGLEYNSYLPRLKAKHCSRATLVKMVAFACFEEEKNKKKTTVSRTLVQGTFSVATCKNPQLDHQNAWHFGTCTNVHLPPQFLLGVECKSGYSIVGCLSLDVLQTDDVLAGTVFHSAQSLEKKCHTN